MAEPQMVLLVFENSSEADVNRAKLFWQSAFLSPHIESRLIADGVKQRLRTAPLPVDQRGNEIKQRTKCYLPPVIQSTDWRDGKTWHERDPHEKKKVDEVNQRRRDIREMLDRHKQKRIVLEDISKRA